MRPNVLIATPMFGGMCCAEYTRSMISTPIMLNQNGIDASVSFVTGNSIIQSARNMLADVFMREASFTHLMFIDADIAFNPFDIITMMKEDKDVICGMYPKKQIDWGAVRDAAVAGVNPDTLPLYAGQLVLNIAGKVEGRANEPVEVSAAGTGFMLIKRSTLEALKPLSGVYIEPDHGPVSEFFFLQRDPVTRIMLSEDYSFCREVREAGMKVWAAPWVKLGHKGQHLFEGGAIAVRPNPSMP